MKNPIKKWRLEELIILKNLYPITPIKNISEILNRSPDSIYAKGEVLGLKKEKKERIVQCYVYVKQKHYKTAKKEIDKLIKQWK